MTAIVRGGGAMGEIGSWIRDGCMGAGVAGSGRFEGTFVIAAILAPESEIEGSGSFGY
jgi:hypothetical protein